MDDEKKTIQMAASGDREAFGLLVSAYGKRLYGFVYGIIRNEHDSLDIVQDTFLKAYSYMDRFDTGRNFVTWIFTIAKNNAFNFLKLREHDSLKYSGENIESLYDHTYNFKSPEDETVEYEERKRLIDAIEHLPEKYRDIICLKYISGLSYREIGIKLGISEKLVESRIYAARQKIIRLMNEGE